MSLDRIQELEEQINQLPKGYISNKNHDGKIQHYLQWQEAGKKYSRYINDKDYEDTVKGIEKRKELQQELKTLLKQNNVEKKYSHDDYIFKTNIIKGTELISYIQDVKDWACREEIKVLEDYLYGTSTGKVLILYGLRRTGKTTLLRQALFHMNQDNFSKSVLIQLNEHNDLAELNEDLKYLRKNNYKYIFLDEVTLMNDFIEGAALLSDLYATCGMKIVLSGTDSLGFMFAEDEELYDRCIMLHTTFISYHEFESVLGIKGIDNYICYGGTMSPSGLNYNKGTFENKSNTQDYVNSAIAKNIQHSLAHYQYEGHFRHLKELYDHHELTSAINRIVEDMNHEFTIKVLTKDFMSHDLSLSAKNLRKENNVLDKIDSQAVIQRLKELCEIKNKDEQSIVITEAQCQEIKEYLDLLDLTLDIKIETMTPQGETTYRTVFTQPGLRYAIAEALVKSLVKDKIFMSISLTDKHYILNRLLNEVKGRMLEDIILLETHLAYPKKDVFKLQFPVGEFDMVVADEQNLTCAIYEIKHSDVIVSEQYRHLIDNAKCDQTEFRYGKITGKYVLYRGPYTVLDNGITYLNVEEYLKSLGE